MTAIKKEVVIGDCRLILGDAREVVPILKYDSIVSDPPYGMSFVSNYRIDKHKAIANDEGVEHLQYACNLPATHSKYIWMRWDNLWDVPLPKSLVTWLKNNHSMGDLEHEHGRKTEVCAFYNGPEHYFPSGRPVDVVYGTRTGNALHPTQKPVDLIRNVVEWTAGTVLDMYMGSGTTGVACAKLGRKFIGIEIDEEYFEISCKRVRDTYAQPDLFVEQPKAPTQEGFDL